ncbi:GFA family protein [Lichenicoccus roseus]|uniref:GFA family protein n=1 Tax=Lichenicoccus roseus TaxID=2683649 RepID=A0A5R9JA90_9PROT|nr:GFA family protein [Lichenicoccus roseus]TLU72521.1 GFA family protein [Lichenicoccus roseus]
MKDKMTGGCFCGAVRYEVEGPPLTTRACWCRDCQYLACGNAAVNVICASAGLKVTGVTTEYVSVADSGNEMRRRFCPTCGTGLFSAATCRPEAVVVRAGTLDDPAPAHPASYIWTSSRPAWGLVDPQARHFEQQPPPPGAARGD